MSWQQWILAIWIGLDLLATAYRYGTDDIDGITTVSHMCVSGSMLAVVLSI